MSAPARYSGLHGPEDLTPHLTAGLFPWPDTAIEAHPIGNLITLTGRVVVDWSDTGLEGNTILRGIDRALWPSSNVPITLWCETSNTAREVHGLRGIWSMSNGSLQLNHQPWVLRDFRSIGFSITTSRRVT